MGAEQPVKTLTSVSKIPTCSLTGKHGTTKSGISLFFLMLHSLFDALDLLPGVLLGVRIATAVLTYSINKCPKNKGRQNCSPTYCRSDRHIFLSASRRNSSPRSFLPPAYTQRGSWLQAPARSPARSLRNSVDLPYAPGPTL